MNAIIRMIFRVLVLASCLTFISRGLRITSVKCNSLKTISMIIDSAMSNSIQASTMKKTNLVKQINNRSSKFEVELRGAMLKNQLGLILDIVSKTNASNIGRSSIHQICKLCIDLNKYEYAPLMLEKLNDNFGQYDDYEIIPFLQACAVTRNLRHGQDVVNVLFVKGMKLSAKSYSILLQGYGKMKNQVKVDELINTCTKRNVKLDLIFLHNAMDSFVRCNNIEKAINIFQLIHPKSKSYTKFWNYPKGSNFPIAVVDSLKQLSVSVAPNVRTFNIVLKVLREMKSNSYLYCADIINDMKLINVNPDSITINTVIDIAVLEDRFEIANELLLNPFAVPSVEAYTSLITGYAGKGDIKGGLRVLELMTSKNVKANSYTLTSLINACMIAKDPTTAKRILSVDAFTLHLSKQEFSAVSGSYLIGLCSLSNNEEIASEYKFEYLLQAMMHFLQMDSKLLTPDLTTINALLQGIANTVRNGVEISLEIMNLLSKDKLIPDDYSYAILLKALGKYGYLNEAFHLFQNVNVNLDSVAYNSLFKAFTDGENPLQAVELFLQMSSNNDKNQDNESMKFGDKQNLSKQMNNNDNIGVRFQDFVPTKATFTILYLALIRSLARDYYRLKDMNKNVNIDANNVNVPNFKQGKVRMELSEDRILSIYDKTIHENSELLKRIPNSFIAKLIHSYIICEYLRLRSLQNNPTDINNSNIMSALMNNQNISCSDLYTRFKVDGNLKQGSLKSNRVLDTSKLEKIVIGNPSYVLTRIYRSMRFQYGVEADSRMISTLNTLFSIINEKQYTLWNYDFNSNDQESARFIFEDLVIAGYDPNEILPILKCCKYSSKKEKELLFDDSAVFNMRSSAASARIFQKHGWNTVDSRWSPL